MKSAISTAGLDVSDLTVSGRHGAVPVRRYTPDASTPGAAALVWMHGGGFAFGDLDMPESHAVAADVARAGRTVYAVDYRRVPMWNLFRAPRPGALTGVRYPIPVDDVVDAIEHAAVSGPVLAGGASAGACLAAGAALRLRTEGRGIPAGLVLAFGTFHATLPPLGDDVVMAKKGRGMSPSMADKMSWNYAGSLEAAQDPYALPGGHDLRALPPALSLTAETDTLRASGDAFARELAESGVPVEHSVIPGSRHGFLNKPGTAPYDDGIARIIAWLSTQDADRKEQS
jgi:acetyl esterase